MIKGPRGLLTGIRIQRKDKRYITFYGEGKAFHFIHIDRLDCFPILGSTSLVEWQDD